MKFKDIFTDRENVLYQYAVFLKWLVIAVAAGFVIGIVGSLFHIVLDFAAEFRGNNSYLIFLLPVGGLAIVWLYRLCGIDHDKGTNGIIKGARGEDTVSLRTAPLIFAATFITHFLGGSAGREGAALQLGGSLISPLAKPLGLKKHDYSMLIMCGMSAGFSALFGTPAAAAVFALEVTVVGIAHYSAIVPCIVSSITAAITADLLGVHPTEFAVHNVPDFGSETYAVALKSIAMGILGAILSIIFCKFMSLAARTYKQLFKNHYLRIFVGGMIVAALSWVLYLITDSYDYNGAGTDIIEKAFLGEARPEAFILKMLLTALTLGAGFKGGEIVPTLFIGSTFGCFAAGFLGLPASFGAALGLAAVFCGVTNCPFATLTLTVELFGSQGLPFYALVVGISYMLSDYTGLYSAQKFYDNKYIHGFFHHTRTYSQIKEASRKAHESREE